MFKVGDRIQPRVDRTWPGNSTGIVDSICTSYSSDILVVRLENNSISAIFMNQAVLLPEQLELDL